MNITPIANGSLANQLSVATAAENPAKAGGSIPFKAMFESMLNEVETLEAQKSRDTMDLALGNADVNDIAQMNINATKAEVALQTVVQMRNKVLDAYSEIMRISL